MIDRLAALPNLAEIPRDQLEWLVERGTLVREDDGFVLRGADDFPGLILLISGRFSVRFKEHGVEREVREITPGRVTGHLPFSKMTNPRGYLVADGPVEFLFIGRSDFPEMASRCYEFTGECVQEMLARVRVFKGEDKHQEKMAALGRLSAGLAHELNNPASAVMRGAGQLDESRREVAAAARALGAAALDEGSLMAAHALEAAAECEEPRSPMERAALEDEIMDWLEGHRLDPDLAYPLTERGLTVAILDQATAAFESTQRAAFVRFVAADVTARALAADILSAGTRIHSLVAAVKKHTHMDRAPTVEPIRIEEHVPDAVTLMGAKASEKDISLDLTVEPDLPMVMGAVADLNQVWIHLIDNAIDAAPVEGRVSIGLHRGRDAVVISVADDGPGIPPENLERVFEPFFTTKDVSQGRGLGLDIVRTVVRTHRGAVELSSEPGRTEFRVTLPAADPSG